MTDQPEIECVMCSTKFSAPVACRDCTEYAQDSVGVPTAPKGVGEMKPIQRHELESYGYGGFDMYIRKFGDWIRVDDIFIELVRLYRRTGSQEVYEVIQSLGAADWEFWLTLKQYEEES